MMKYIDILIIILILFAVFNLIKIGKFIYLDNKFYKILKKYADKLEEAERQGMSFDEFYKSEVLKGNQEVKDLTDWLLYKKVKEHYLL